MLVLILILIVILLVDLILIAKMKSIRQFEDRADFVIEWWFPFFREIKNEKMLEILRRNFSSREGKIELKCCGKKYVHRLEFSDPREAILDFENIIKDALKCYDRLGGVILLVKNPFIIQLMDKQEELQRIRVEVKKMKNIT